MWYVDVVAVVAVDIAVVVVVSYPDQRDEEDAPNELADAHDQEQHSGLQVGS